MIVIPAIDLKGGRCVRLFQGDLDQETVYGEDPAAMAERWAGEGAAWLHLVDLDGSVAGAPAHLDELRAIRKRISIPIEVGGGVRTAEHAEQLFDAGADRLILGTLALSDPDLLEALCKQHPGAVYVALDARDGEVAVRGWTEGSGVTAVEAASRCEARGAAGILFTDIARDGTGRGVNVEATAALADEVSIPVVASGGVASLEDVRAVCAVESRGVEALIVGRALYTGAVSLPEALAEARAYGGG